MKLTNQQYKFVCEILWGGAPVEKYPMLEKSFNEIEIGFGITKSDPTLKSACTIFEDFRKTWTSELEESLIKQATIELQNVINLRNKNYGSNIR